jgi:ADP-ribosylglycohydrolase
MATAKACLKLWIGFPVARSGVSSAGNGPAMRAGIIGVYAWDDLNLLRELVTASTRITHTDAAAEHGALAIALAAAHVVGVKTNGREVLAEDYLQFVRPCLAGTEMLCRIEELVEYLRSGMSLKQYLKTNGLERGVSGYINHTVPACLYCWLAHPQDFRTAVEQIIVAGGDADSTGAIVGALAGVTMGPGAIPSEWVADLFEWPRSMAWIVRLADSLAADRLSPIKSHRPLALFWPGLLVRNAFFLGIVLLHGLRRLLPPY